MVDEAFSKIIPVRDLLKSSWVDLKSHLWTYLGISLIPTVTMFFSGIIVGLISVGSLAAISKQVISGSPSSSVTFIILMVVLILAVLVINTVFTWSHLALIVAIAEKVGFSAAFGKARHFIVKSWWVSFISGFLILGSFPTIVFPLVMSIWFIFSNYIVVSEDTTGLNVLLKSREYTRGLWWSILGRLLLLGIVYCLFLGVIEVIRKTTSSEVLPSILSLALNLCIGPYFVIYIYNLYNDIKFRKGSFEFNPSPRRRLKYILLSLLGIICQLAIIGFLIYGMVVFRLKDVQLRANEARSNANLQSIRWALSMYYTDNASYPPALDDLQGKYGSYALDTFDYQILDNGSDYLLCIGSFQPPICSHSIELLR